MRSLKLLACLVVFALTGGAALAQADRTIARMTPDDVLNFLSAQGLEASHPPNKTHRPAIRARLGRQPGMVFLYDCQDASCGSLKFVAFGKAGPKHDLAFLNAWNSKRRYVAAYLHGEEVYLYLDYDLRAGTTSAALTQALKTFELAVRDFGSFTP